jgi:hypothetical protein
MFEGLGLGRTFKLLGGPGTDAVAAGTRLAFLTLPESVDYLPFAGALAYACVTPFGMAIGLGLRESIVRVALGSRGGRKLTFGAHAVHDLRERVHRRWCPRRDLGWYPHLYGYSRSECSTSLPRLPTC